MPFNILQWIIIIPILLFAITIHEYAHGRAALWLGDPTAKNMGRLTLNPLPHIDPLGALCLFLTKMIGWAKPVPVDPRYFKNFRRDIIIMSLCGPFANLLAAFLTGMFIRYSPVPWQDYKMAQIICWAFMRLNLGLALFNLLPLPPLDGSHVLENALSPGAAQKYRELGRYVPFLLIGIIFVDHYYIHTSILDRMLRGPIDYLARLFSGVSF